jgi:hypothetical protein
VRYVERDSTFALVAAVVFACLAVAIRPVGVFLSGVLVLAPWAGRGALVRRVAGAAGPLFVLLLLTFARPALTVPRADLTWIVGSYAWRAAYWTLDLASLPTWLALHFTVVVGTLGTALVPLALGGLGRENARATLAAALPGAAALSATLVLHQQVRTPLHPEFTWSLRELGGTETLVPPLEVPGQPFGRALALMLAAVLLLALALAPLLRQRPPRKARSLAWGALGYFVLTAILWMFYDRYLLPLVVLVAALRLATAEIARPRLALVGVALLAAMSVVGTWDHLQYSRALWDAVGWARRAGIADGALDGGYVVNGWLQYAHPEHAPRAANGDVRVPSVNGGEPPRYRIGNDVPSGTRVLHTVTYRRILAPSGSIYVIDRARGPS